MLAIVIPYYKITFFEATLQSLANQTDKRFKAYIADNVIILNNAFLLKIFLKMQLLEVLQFRSQKKTTR